MHLSLEEKITAAVMYNDGYSAKVVAETLGISAKTALRYRRGPFKRPSKTRSSCGTLRGYARHTYYNERICAACKGKGTP